MNLKNLNPFASRGNGGNNDNEHVTYAKEAYAAFTSKQGAATARLYDCYMGMRTWAGISEGDAKDQGIMASFKSLRNDGYNEAIEIRLWKELNQIWVSNTKTLHQDEKERTIEQLETISTLTPKEEAQTLSKRLLANHVIIAKPAINNAVPGAEHYQYFADKVVVKSQVIGDYKNNDHGWYLVHDVLQKSWLASQNIAPGGFDDLIERGPADEPQGEPERRDEPIPTPQHIPAEPAPPPMPFAFEQGGIPVEPVKQEVPVKKVKEPKNFLRPEESLADLDIGQWIATNLKMGAPSAEPLTGEVYQTFEGSTMREAEDVALAQIGGRMPDTSKSEGARILRTLMTAIEGNNGAMAHFASEYQRAIKVTREVNRYADQEAGLIVALKYAEGLVSGADMANFKKYLESRVKAIQSGYQVVCDVNGTFYIARERTE